MIYVMGFIVAVQSIVIYRLYRENRRRNNKLRMFRTLINGSSFIIV